MWRSLLVAGEEWPVARLRGRRMDRRWWPSLEQPKRSPAVPAQRPTMNSARPARVHPDPAVVVTPCPIQDAAAAAELTSELDAEARVGLAEMTGITLGFANDDMPVEVV
jgi:hypothetical protein